MPGEKTDYPFDLLGFLRRAIQPENGLIPIFMEKFHKYWPEKNAPQTANPLSETLQELQCLINLPIASSPILRRALL